MGSNNRVPLFINRYSLSPRTAIGVQTLRLLGPHQDWLHFHWWTNSFQRRIPAPFCLRTPFSAGTPSFTDPNLCES